MKFFGKLENLFLKKVFKKKFLGRFGNPFFKKVFQ